MKKSLFVVGMAALALASCTNEEVLNVADNRAISFDGFVGNTTKAEITDANIREFYVFGGYDGSTNNVFNGVKVYTEDNGTSWKYDDLKYWMANQTYTFQAYAPVGMTATPTANGLEFTGVVADGQTDLISSDVESVPTNDDISSMAAVQLDFKHLMSKIQFQFTTTLADVNIAISDLKVNGVPNTANYTISGKWDTPSGSKDYELTMNTLTDDAEQTSSYAIVIPQTPSNITVSFTLNATGALTVTNAQHTVTLPNNAWEPGFSYTYTAEININNIDPDEEFYPIVFGDPTVGGWEDGGEQDVTDDIQ